MCGRNIDVAPEKVQERTRWNRCGDTWARGHRLKSLGQRWGRARPAEQLGETWLGQDNEA